MPKYIDGDTLPLLVNPFFPFIPIMSDIEEQSLGQGGKSDQSSQNTGQTVAFEVEQADSDVKPRPWYVV